MSHAEKLAPAHSEPAAAPARPPQSLAGVAALAAHAAPALQPRMPLFGLAAGLQAKLAVGAPDDPAEREADAVAEQVLRDPAPQMRRTCACGGAAGPDGECAACKVKRLQRRSSTASTHSVAPPSVHATVNTPGRPLEPAVRSYMEPRFGADFSQVRVHTDPAAARSAQDVGALAYTAGSHLVFAPGQYRPQTEEGRRLIAHELAHTIQQLPFVARDNGDETAATCNSGHQEGQGEVAEMSPDLADALGLSGQSTIYLIWGTWQEGDSIQRYAERIMPRWISWRFGEVPAAERRRILDILGTRVRQFIATPTPGCQYAISVPMPMINQIEGVATRGRGTAAGERERRAGLPSPAEVRAGTVGGAQPQPEAAREGATPQPAGPQPEYVYQGSERRANAPALPARIVGPEQQVTRGIGTYRMQLDYWPAGPTLLAQVVEAMNWVNYHWEVYDISRLVRRGLAAQASALRHTAPSQTAAVGPMAATGRRFERRSEELAEDATTATRDLVDTVAHASERNPGEVVTNVLANYTNLNLLPASAIVALGGQAIGALADLLGGTFQEREIPWPASEGYFMIRCIAAPSPQGREGEIRRAASVATKIVEVQNPRRRATASLGDPEAAIAETNLALALERDPERRRQLEAQLAEQRAVASGTAVEVIEAAISRLERDQATAIGRRRRQIDEELARLRERLALARGRWSVPVSETTRIYRPRAVLVSDVTGETYPLLLQFIELPQEGGRFRVELSDVTSRDGRPYVGRGASLTAAAWNALEALGGQSDYGRGYLAIRLPAGEPFGGAERTIRSAPRGLAQTRERLNDLVTVLVVLGLFVPGVGQAAAVLGAAMAAERLIDRWRNQTLRLDAAAVGDVISVLGAAAQGVAAIGRVRVVRAANRFALVDAADDAALSVARGALESAETFASRAALLAQIADYGGMVYGNLETLGQIVEINQAVIEGRMSHAEARRRRAELLTAAIRDNIIQFLEPRTRRETETRPPTTPEARPPTTPETRPPTTPEARPPTTPEARPPTTPEARPPEPRPESGGASVDPSPVRPGAPGTEHPPARGDERVRTAVPTPDGLHTITILADGRIIRCQTCGEIRAHYGDFLGEYRDPARQRDDAVRGQAEALHQRLESLARESAENERQIREETDPTRRQALIDEQSRLATEVGGLDAEIRRFAAQQLVQRLGVTGSHAAPRVEILLGTLTPAQVIELRSSLGSERFQLLVGVAGRDPARAAQISDIVRQVARVWQLSYGDATAHAALAEAIGLRRSNEHLLTALTNVGNLYDRYPGQVSGNFILRYLRAEVEGRASDARAELRLAEDILAGRSPLGTGRHVEGLPESATARERTPEYRITAPGGADPRLAEVKQLRAMDGDTIQRNLSSAVGQIIQHAMRSTMERGGFIRLDASEVRTSMSPAEIQRAVNGIMNPDRTRGAFEPGAAGETPATTPEAPPPRREPATPTERAVRERFPDTVPEGDRGRWPANYVEWVEVLYQDAAGQPHRLLMQMRRTEAGTQLVVVEQS